MGEIWIELYIELDRNTFWIWSSSRSNSVHKGIQTCELNSFSRKWPELKLDRELELEPELDSCSHKLNSIGSRTCFNAYCKIRCSIAKFVSFYAAPYRKPYKIISEQKTSCRLFILVFNVIWRKLTWPRPLISFKIALSVWLSPANFFE